MAFGWQILQLRIAFSHNYNDPDLEGEREVENECAHKQIRGRENKTKVPNKTNLYLSRGDTVATLISNLKPYSRISATEF